MCVVSMVGDHYRDKWGERDWFPKVWPPQPYRVYPNQTRPSIPVDREEFDRLKDEVRELRDLLKRAKEYDERNNEPECEVEEKMEILRRVAELVGVDLSDVIGKPVQ